MKNFKWFYTLLTSLLMIVGLNACQSQPSQQTSTDKSANDSGHWVWYDLVAHDVAQAQGFYSRVFGWEFEKTTVDGKPYWLASLNGSKVAGLLNFNRQPESYRHAVWINFLSVNSVDDAVQIVRQGQGEVIVDVEFVPGRGGQLAVVKDAEEAVFGLVSSKEKEKALAETAVNHFVWSELWADDLQRMAGFYAALASYEIEKQQSVDDLDEVVLLKNNRPHAGIIQIAREHEKSAWLPYIRVQNLQQTLQRVSAAGGEILVEPSEKIRNGKVSVIKDNQGAAIGLFEWPAGKMQEAIR